jgi:serine/threonine-protein kinase
VDHRADLFAAGVILWELYTNMRLFGGDSEMEMMHKVRDSRVSSVQRYNSEVPDMAAQIVRKALFADRSLRFQTAAEFQKSIEVLARRNAWPMTVEALKPLLGG